MSLIVIGERDSFNISIFFFFPIGSIELLWFLTQYPLSFFILREIVNDERIAVRASPGCETAPSPISPHQSPYYTNVTQSVSRAFGSRVPFSAPSLMIGNTDTRWYWNLTSNIYRFTPLILTVEELKMFHGNDERIRVEALADMVLYYVLFVSKSCVSGEEDV